MRDTDSRVSYAEKQIDEFFEERLPLRGIWKSVAIDALLDRAELLVTGHRASGEKYRHQIHSLYRNVSDGLNRSLRAAHRLGLDRRALVPDYIDSLAIDSIALGMIYEFIEDAFYSYWKGYANAVFPGDREISFVPTGAALDARLRFHQTSDGLEITDEMMKTLKKNPLADPATPTAQRFADSLMKNSELKQEGGFIYSIDDSVMQDLAGTHFDYLSVALGSVPPIRLGSFSFSDLARGWSIVWAVSQIHLLVSVLLSRDPSDLTTSVNWPALVRKKDEWLRWLSVMGCDRNVLTALSFEYEDKGGDITVTPLVCLDDEHIGVVPSIMFEADSPRNLLALLAKRFNEAYSRYSATKEDRLLSDLRTSFPAAVIGTKVVLPRWQGRQLPDIDVILRDRGREQIVVTEVKWQLSARGTRAVVARNDYLKKGREQLALIRAFLEENPSFLQERGCVDFRTEKGDLYYLLLCKGHLGSEDVIGPGMIMADYDVFSKYLAAFGLSEAIERVGSYDYLPRPGQDFVLEDRRVRFGGWLVSWKQFGWPDLPPDDETEVLEELYRRTAQYL